MSNSPDQYRTATYNGRGRRVATGIKNTSLAVVRQARSDSQRIFPNRDLRIEALIDGVWELYDQ